MIKFPSSDWQQIQTQTLPSQKKPESQEKLQEASQDFEQLFIQQMLKTMRDATQKSDLLPESNGEKTFKSMLDQEYAQMASRTRAFGLGEMIYNEYKHSVK